ncbi:hypothetical protein PPACK8108_LOCUS15829 [Phakopsora pachyrhizi]|uniref:Uncharacterized protein n=1 Tax=Phakopsora pachyrhizi TaxID=170000 RepID=A0AAV0B715_PHAPC|nr:hypothetical protein PPACK8108_LOCUS15829 [Phakopsora pachyrhizi]
MRSATVNIRIPQKFWKLGGGATDEHSVGGGEDVINEEAEAEGSLIDLQAQPASKYEHIHPSESDSQHNIHHHPEG